MNCEHVEALVVDHLRHRLPEAEEHELTTHIAGCDRCAREVESLGTIWNLMESLPGGDAGEACRRRLEGTIRGYAAGLEDAGARRIRPVARRMLTAAAAGIILLLGVAAGFMMSRGGAGTEQGDRYLLLVYTPPEASGQLTALERSRRDEAYSDWYKELRKGARLIGWTRLDPGTGRSLKQSGEVEELLPIALREANEHLMWVIVIRAESAEDAATVARGCPALATGARVEIRPESRPKAEPGGDPT